MKVKWHAERCVHVAWKSESRDSYFMLIVRPSVTGIGKNFEESIGTSHWHIRLIHLSVIPSLTALPFAWYPRIQCDMCRSVLQHLTWENNRRNDVFYWTNRSYESFSFYPYAWLERWGVASPRTRRDAIKTSLIWLLCR